MTEGGVGSWGDVEGSEGFWAIRRHDDAYPSRSCHAEIEAIEGGLVAGGGGRTLCQNKYFILQFTCDS